jgi:hypothetical protein
MNQLYWVDFAQTTALFGALLFTAFEFRARKRELRFRNYLDGISGFNDLAKLMIERTELHALYNYTPVDLPGEYDDLTAEEKSLVHYCDSIIALCETVWLAGTDGWLPKDEWLYWLRWVAQLNGSPFFRWTLKWVQGDYDSSFLQSLKKAGDHFLA